MIGSTLQGLQFQGWCQYFEPLDTGVCDVRRAVGTVGVVMAERMRLALSPYCWPGHCLSSAT